MNAIRDVAQAFVEARKSGRAIAQYPGRRPADLGEAYAIQDDALTLWDRPVVGWKVGKINPPLDAQLGADRLVGPIFDGAIVEAGDDAPTMPVFKGGFAAVEAEFMLRIAAPDGASIPQSNAEAMQWIDCVRIGIEVASSPYAGINEDGPCVTISDHGNNAGVVLGADVARDMWARLDEVVVTLEIDDETIGEATTATMLDGPFGAARFLLQNLDARGITPRNGWWISSGAITGVHEIAAGSKATAKFENIGSVPAAIAFK